MSNHQRVYTYQLKPFHNRILKEIKFLNKEVYNYVIEQSYTEPNLTIRQLKRSIYRSVRFFVKKSLGDKYRYGVENEILKYYCFFETTKEFNLSNLNINKNVDVNKMGLHFHLFISSSDPSISPLYLKSFLEKELYSFPLKKKSISKFDSKLYQNKLDMDFVLYHTKQYRDYPNELILKNFNFFQ